MRNRILNQRVRESYRRNAYMATRSRMSTCPLCHSRLIHEIGVVYCSSPTCDYRSTIHDVTKTERP